MTNRMVSAKSKKSKKNPGKSSSDENDGFQAQRDPKRLLKVRAEGLDIAKFGDAELSSLLFKMKMIRADVVGEIEQLR